MLADALLFGLSQPMCERLRAADGVERVGEGDDEKAAREVADSAIAEDVATEALSWLHGPPERE